MRNPYVIGSWVCPPHFYGHEAFIDDILNTREQCLYLVGNRRVGKTSLLHYIERQAPGITLYLDLEGTLSNPSEMGRSLIKRAKRKAGGFPYLRDIPFGEQTDICDVIELLADAADREGDPLWLLVDEAEMLQSLDDHHLKRLRSLSQDQTALHTILAATKKLSELNDRCRNWETSPFLSGFATRHIPPLTDQAASNLICQVNHPKGQVSVEETLQAKIRELTGNHPNLIQLLCDRLFESEGRLRPITEHDLIVNHTLADFFKIDYGSLSPLEIMILKKLSKDESADENELLRATKKSQLDDLRSHLYGLEELGCIRNNQGRYQIANHFLRSWLKMRTVKTTPVVSDRASLEVIGNISVALLSQIRSTLARSPYFADNAILQTLFIDPRIKPWRDTIPTTPTVAARVDALIDTLHERRTARGESALSLFLQVLAASISPADACHNELNRLAAEVAHVASSAARTRDK
ncbi:MAG: ATP-binding protein [Anaerolineae bacterium]|nr:ATP-binding protein [Anaerolineae bacterium]